MQSLRKFDEKETVAIIGDGPIALLEAIELAKKGVKSVIIGPRHGRYTRSGDIVPEVFQKITKMVGFNVLPSARGAHIKDIERKLYEEAKKMSNITFINGKFAGFEGERQLVIEHNNESDKKKEHIKAYIAIDCTGTKRAVIQAFNESIKQKPEYKSNPFSITRLCNPKMPHHFIAARTLLTEDELTIYTKPSEISPQSTPPLSYALMIITLKELGWTSLVPPFFYINSPDYENHGFTNMSFTRTFKSNIYSNTFDADEKEITSDENMIKYIQVAFKFF